MKFPSAIVLFPLAAGADKADHFPVRLQKIAIESTLSMNSILEIIIRYRQLNLWAKDMNRIGCRHAIASLLMLGAAMLDLVWAGQSVAQEPTVSGFELRPGVIVDPDRQLAYVMSPEGETVAVDLADGTEAWSTAEAAKPLALVGDLLIGQAPPADAENELEIVVLDAAEQGRRVVAETMELPADVRVTIDETLESSFVADARPLADDAAVFWQYAERLMQGIPPEEEVRGMPPEEEIRGEAPAITRAAADRQVDSGAFVMDLTSGAMSALQPEQVVVAPAQRTLDLGVAERLPDVPGPQFLSADGRHVLSSERIADDSVWEKYRWTIHDRSTGEALGEFTTFQSMAPFFVTDSQVIYETPPYAQQVQGELRQEPLKIRAVDLATGEEVWNREVRDTTFRGPFPP